ncbi:MAG: His/Gly/Thr/Pro-type tRNA ligase C-terminal domain-containing protein [Candidatus Nanoarchaeia archaeon]|nr:His/Gly/Thr/Pro-type tRNA ligase C-terminal domain-containing protein [Candidatus Nanoarchaeia archaeon]
MIIKNKTLDYATWWNKIIQEGDIVDIRYDVKGFFVWKPYGFSIMKNIKSNWEILFKKNNIKEVYFPLFVPVEYAAKNKSWWDSFKEQAFYVLGYYDKEKRIFIRPTGEPAMYPVFSKWIRSHRDLPLRIYQTVMSYRNETKSTKSLVRDVEIGPWYEIHTCHSSAKEAEEEINLAIKMNEHLFNLSAIAYLKVRKPKADCFPGSVGAVEFYTLMNDGVIENGSCNNLGQAYAKAFNITYTYQDQKKDFVWQTCTGNGERFLSAILANHSDEKGIVIPPKVAPIKAQIIYIKLKEEIEITTGLSEEHLEYVNVNDSGELGEVRFNSEKRGIPARIEIGPKELDEKICQVVWRDGIKNKVSLKDLKKEIEIGLERLQKKLQEENHKELNSRIKECDTFEEAKKASIALIGWCGGEECGGWIKNKTSKEIIGMTLKPSTKKCIHCGEKGEATYIAKSY